MFILKFFQKLLKPVFNRVIPLIADSPCTVSFGYKSGVTFNKAFGGKVKIERYDSAVISRRKNDLLLGGAVLDIALSSYAPSRVVSEI